MNKPFAFLFYGGISRYPLFFGFLCITATHFKINIHLKVLSVKNQSFYLHLRQRQSFLVWSETQKLSTKTGKNYIICKSFYFKIQDYLKYM